MRAAYKKSKEREGRGKGKEMLTAREEKKETQNGGKRECDKEMRGEDIGNIWAK